MHPIHIVPKPCSVPSIRACLALLVFVVSLRTHLTFTAPRVFWVPAPDLPPCNSSRLAWLVPLVAHRYVPDTRPCNMSCRMFTCHYFLKHMPPFSCHHAHVLKNISNDLIQIGFPFLRVLHPNIPLLLPQHSVFSNKTHVMPLPYSG
jgi:hypothetical protein